MNSEKLALFGGPKSISTAFKPYRPLGKEEVEAAKAVVESGMLSNFIGCWVPEFYGGPKVKEFEKDCAEFFGVKHAVAVNSWTSGLIAAVGAIGIEPGDEIIVSPWTMCASATAIQHFNAIPVFADIEPETFCLDPASVEANITAYTKAIVVIDIFGHSADMDAFRDIAHRHKLKLIGDSAQAPATYYKDKMTGTMTDVGGYSLNYHKHIHTGEGGILITDDDNIAERLQLIRNHAEAVVGGKGTQNLSNMIGYNFRLGEIEAAIGIEQLKKLPGLVTSRQYAAERLTKGLTGLSGLRLPIVKSGCTHAYYMYPMVLDITILGVSRARIVEALEAEGVAGLEAGYANLHMLPIFQKKIAYGSKGFPWTSDICQRDVDYSRGICPVAEKLHEETYLSFETCTHDLGNNEVEQLVSAFQKVWSHMNQLK